MQLNDKSLLQIFRHFVPVKIFRNPGAMKFNAIVALLLVMAVAPAYAAPVGYSVVTLSSSGCGSSSLTSSATYNVSIYGANFPEPPIQSLFAYTQTGSTDTTGELTSCWDQTSVACYPDTTVCASCPTMKGNSSATSNIATGLLHTSSYGFAHYGQGISDATMSDTLHFTIAGATGTTVTPITVKWKLNADWGTGDPNVESGWVVQCKSWFTFGGTANIDISGSFGAPVAVTSYPPSGWASYNYASLTTSNVDFTGVYNLVGSSVTLPFYHAVEGKAAGGIINTIYNALATTVDCYSASPVELILPANVSFTSASGVFLVANRSALMSMVPSGVKNYYNKVLDAYGAIPSGSSVTWLLKQQDFPESLDIDKVLNITLKGGYDSTFGTNSGNYSTLQGITIGVGSLTVENIRII